MLYTTSWVIETQNRIPVDGKVYLRKVDAQAALDMRSDTILINGQYRAVPLALAERKLVIAFGITDTKVSPESVADKLLTEGT